MPKVSIITPSMNRHHFLPMLWDCVRTQSVFQDIEWLVHDGSEQAAEFDWLSHPQIRYLHGPGEMTIGAKRNVLCAAAQGEIIAHFDDDDYYAPQYIENMLSLMTERNVDFVKLFGFFLYQRTHEVFAYWDLVRDFPWHWRLEPNVPPWKERNNGHMSGRWGYGFSYVYRRQLWEACQFIEQPRFPGDRGFGEDQIFADAVPNCRKAGKQDYSTHENDFIAGSCIHVIHASNMSLAYPQQILPRDWLRRFFPHFDARIR
jgi:glycosyltransferase involved in cell wall biosynthesis